MSDLLIGKFPLKMRNSTDIGITSERVGLGDQGVWEAGLVGRTIEATLDGWKFTPEGNEPKMGMLWGTVSLEVQLGSLDLLQGSSTGRYAIMYEPVPLGSE